MGIASRTGQIIAILAFLIVFCPACDDPPTRPSPPPPTTTSTPPTPPPHNPGRTFSWDNTRGFLLFPGTQDVKSDIIGMHWRLRRANWPVITWHVCAEVAQWEATPWRDGPHQWSVENRINLQRFLDTTAELGDQVLLDVLCTIRDDPSQGMGAYLEWANYVGGVASAYNHIAIHIANEHWHPASQVRDVGRIRQLRDALRQAGFDGPIGADDNFNLGDITYNPALRALGFWPDAHPWRNPDPTNLQIKEMVQKNGGFLVISEPTAYSRDYSGGLVTRSRRQITDYMRACEDVPGCVYTFHSTCPGLEGLVCNPDWIPGE